MILSGGQQLGQLLPGPGLCVGSDPASGVSASGHHHPLLVRDHAGPAAASEVPAAIRLYLDNSQDILVQAEARCGLLALAGVPQQLRGGPGGLVPAPHQQHAQGRGPAAVVIPGPCHRDPNDMTP